MLLIINNIEISQYNEFQHYLDKYNIQSYLALPLYPPKVKICTCGLIPLYIDLVCFDVHYKYQVECLILIVVIALKSLLFKFQIFEM